MTTESIRTPFPAAWRLAHVMQQLVVLVLAGVALVLATWSSPMYKAIFAGLPDLVVPPGLVVPSRLVLPFAAPVLLGLPLALGRQRPLLLLWVTLMTLASLLAVIEVSRLNWAAFVSGVAFRIESGPVPFLRTVAGAAVLLSGVMLLGHQAVLRTVRHLAERGVPLRQLRETRANLLALERALVLGLFAATVVLTLIALVSMQVTESAPEAEGSWVAPLLWTAVLLVVVVAAFALGLWRHRGRVAGRDRRA